MQLSSRFGAISYRTQDTWLITFELWSFLSFIISRKMSYSMSNSSVFIHFNYSVDISSFQVSLLYCHWFSRVSAPSRFIFQFQHQAVEPGHNGEPGARAAILVEQDHRLALAPVVQHQRVARERAPSHSFVGPLAVQVLALGIHGGYETQIPSSTSYVGIRICHLLKACNRDEYIRSVRPSLET